MEYYLESILLISSEALPVLIGAFRYRKFDLPLKLFFLLCIISLATELLAMRAAMSTERNNMAVYNVSSLLITTIFCLYFNYSIAFLRRWKMGAVLSMVSVILWIIAVQIGGSIEEMHPFFLYFQCLAMIILGMVSIMSMHKSGTIYTHSRSVHFWISLLTICSSCMFFIQWGIYAWLLKNHPSIPEIINVYFIATNCLLNLGFSAILWFYKKNGRHVN